MTTDTHAVTDTEIEDLMAELEAENEKIISDQAAALAAESPAPIAVAVATIVAEEGPPFEPDEEDAPIVTTEDMAAQVRVAPEVEEAITKAITVESKDQPKAPKTELSEDKATTVAGLNHYVDINQFRTDTKVTEATLDVCMIEQNGLRAYYGVQAANAEAQASRLDARFDVVEATLYDQHRKELAASGEKTTEKMIDAAVKMDPRWLKGKNLVIEADTIAAINKSLVESLKDRRDMIIQLGADRRDEYKGAARVLEQKNASDDLRERAGNSAKRG